MTTTAKFLFDTEFDPTATDEPSQASKARAKPKPQYTDDDLAAARGEGQKAGFEQGVQHALGEIEKTAADALQQIAVQIAHLGRAQERAVINIRADAARLAFGIADRLAAGLVEREPLGEIESLISECLERLQAEPRIVIRVAEDLVDPLHQRIGQLSESTGFAGKMVLIGEPQMPAGDCRIEWADGGAERDMAVLVSEVGDAVQRYLGLQADAAAALPEAAEPPAAAADASATTEPAATNAADTTDPLPSPTADDVDPDDPLANDSLPTLAAAPDAGPPAAESTPGIDE